MTGTRLNPAGDVSLADLDIINTHLGRDFLPYPFIEMQREYTRSYDEQLAYAKSVIDRYLHGDAGEVRRWFSSYHQADIRVEARSYEPHRALRMVAHRSGDRGYFALQRPDADVVEISTVSPYDLGAAIADRAPLTKPGRQPQIMTEVQAQRERARSTNGDEMFTTRQEVVATSPVKVSQKDIVSFGEVQSRWQPAREWGLDDDKPGVLWITVRDDGDYIVSSDFSYLLPVARKELRRRIDALIADDVRAVREARGISPG